MIIDQVQTQSPPPRIDASLHGGPAKLPLEKSRTFLLEIGGLELHDADEDTDRLPGRGLGVARKALSIIAPYPVIEINRPRVRRSQEDGFSLNESGHLLTANASSDIGIGTRSKVDWAISPPQNNVLTVISLNDGSGDDLIMKRIRGSESSEYVDWMLRAEKRRIVDGWLSGKAVVSGEPRPPLFEDRVEKNPNTGKRIGAIEWFERHYKQLSDYGVLNQRDLAQLDKVFYDSLAVTVRNKKGALGNLAAYLPGATNRHKHNLN